MDKYFMTYKDEEEFKVEVTEQNKIVIPVTKNEYNVKIECNNNDMLKAVTQFCKFANQNAVKLSRAPITKESLSAESSIIQ